MNRFLTKLYSIIFHHGLLYIILFLLSTTALSQSQKLDEKALTSKLFDENGQSNELGAVLKNYENQAIFIDLWASWCKDCIVGFPKIKEYQNKYDKIAYLYLSVDKKEDEWKRGIERFQINGDHYRIDQGWSNYFCEAIVLDWVPRYLIVDSEGNILHFKSIEADDKSLVKTLKTYN